MASFDKKNAPAAGSSKKKNIFAAVLAAVLAVVVVHHFTKTPATEAANNNAGAAGMPIDLTSGQDNPASVRAALDSEVMNPSRKSPIEGLTAIDSPPKDPFQLSQTWREKLIKPVTVVSNNNNDVSLVPHDNGGVRGTEPKSNGPAWDGSGLKLSGIFKGNVRTYAVINGSIVTEGMIVGGARVTEIVEDHVTLQPLGAPDSARVDLMIKRPGMK